MDATVSLALTSFNDAQTTHRPDPANQWSNFSQVA